MMSLEDEDRIRELLPGYALDALTPEETYLVDHHLSGCQSCQVELARLQQITEDLPLALAQTSPPAALKARIMRDVHVRQSPSAQLTRPKFWQQVGQFLQKSVPAMAVVVIAALAILSISLWNRLNQVASVPTPQMRLVALVNTDAAPGANGTLILDLQGKYGTLVVDKLQALSASQQYQVWLIKNGERTSGGVFSVNPEGYGSVELWATQPLGSYDAIGITIEPAGGSPAPTGAKVLGGNITD